MITRDELIELLQYDPATGSFTWARDVGYRFKSGQKAGHTHSCGYVVIRIRRRQYMAHRLAWLYMTGDWPSEIDHTNGIKSDNRFSNLRSCTKTQNQANKLKGRTNTSGYVGVAAGYKGKWNARIRVSGRLIHLGTFPTAEAASKAYMAAAEAVHGEFAAHISRGTI